MSSQMRVQAQALPQVETAQRAKVETAVQAASRLWYVDYLRAFLTILVVVHHLAITYGASGSWFYTERPATFPAEVLLTLFTGLNQFYFMGLFFFLSGYFVPGALDRKGPRRFLKDRLVRLGIPLVLFALLVSPFVIFISGKYEGWWTGSLSEFLSGYWTRSGFESGPLWFVEALLIFTLVYVLGRALILRLKTEANPGASQPAQIPLTNGRILAAILVLALASLLVRLVSPIDATWHNFQLAFFPQYIVLFTAGILASRQGWLTHISDQIGKTWRTVALVAMACFPVMMIGLVAVDPEAAGANLEQAKGGLTFLAAFTAAWEAVSSLSMPFLLLSIFRRWFNHPNPVGQFLSRNAFTVYIIHAPVIVLTAVMFRSLALDPLLKFALVAPLGVGLCFLVSPLVRRLPLADRVL